MEILFSRCLKFIQAVVIYFMLLGKVSIFPSIQEGPSVYVRMGLWEIVH